MKIPKIIDDELRLPETIIQHIQSFLSGIEAAQTSILSKSWHRAWSTRPNLDFNQHEFGRQYRTSSDVKRFIDSSRKTMQRYEESKLNIESFNLHMDRTQSDNCILGDELVAKALKLGATEVCLSVRHHSRYTKFPTSINACEFHNLKFLLLECLNIDPLFSDGSSSCEFPCLKVLTLNNCLSEKGTIRISSPSLEHVSFLRNTISGATLDVPNIRKFTFSGCNTLPSLSFEEIASVDWVSDVSIEFWGFYFNTSWFLELEKFLEKLSDHSRIYLSLEIRSAISIVFDYARDIWRPKPVVENLKVKLHPKHITKDYDLMGCLFRSVEPKFITQYWEDLRCREWSWKIDDINFLELLCRTLMLDVASENSCRNMSRLAGLEEVNVECFEAALAKWRPLSLKTLLDASTSLEDKQLIRFRLRWR